MTEHTTITLPRSVLEQALEILDSLLPATTKDYFPAWLPQDAIDSLKCRDSVRAALEHPQVEREPVAWLWSSGGNKSSLTFGGPNSNTPKDWDVQPLYTHPQPRQPLTDAEILMVLDAADIPDLPRDFKDVDIDIARAIEAAHGIGGEA